MPVALFDHLVNNTDRKGGHLLLDGDGRIWAIDHALTFHAEPKLRTVIWDFAGQPIPAALLSSLESLRERLRAGQPLQRELADLLDAQEVGQLRARLRSLLASQTFPIPDPRQVNLPWPLV